MCFPVHPLLVCHQFAQWLSHAKCLRADRMNEVCTGRVYYGVLLRYTALQNVVTTQCASLASRHYSAMRTPERTESACGDPMAHAKLIQRI